MNIRITLPPLLILLVATLFATTQSSSAIAPDHGPAAFGEGSFNFFNGVRVEHWSFSFETMANKTGQARGRAIFDITENSIQTQVVVKINCLDVTESSGILDALITGTVLHSDDPDFPKRANVKFVAEDSSGFSTVRPDVITPLFVNPLSGGDCHDSGFPLTMFQLPPNAITIQP